MSLFVFLQRHDHCANEEPTECTCGPLRDHILPPWAIYPIIKVQNYPQAHLEHTYSINRTCHTNADNKISPGLFLVVGTAFLPERHFNRYSVKRFFFVLKRQEKSLHFLWVIHSLLLFCSLKERPNNVKNGCSGSSEDSELNTTPDGQVLQVLFCPLKACNLC